MAFALFPGETRSSLYQLTQSTFIKIGSEWNISTSPTQTEVSEIVGEISFWDFQDILVLGFSSSYSEKNGIEVFSAGEIVEAIVKSGKQDCLYLTLHEDFIWQYELFADGNSTAYFSKYAGYFDEVEESTCGDPEKVAELFSVPVSRLAGYHLRMITNENYEKVLLNKSTGYSGGVSNHTQPDQGFDFATALGANVGETPPTEEWIVGTGKNKGSGAKK